MLAFQTEKSEHGMTQKTRKEVADVDLSLPSFEDLIRTNSRKKAVPVQTRQLSTIAPVARENKLKVAGYTRISTDHEEQLTSSRIQKEHLLSVCSTNREVLKTKV